MAELYVVATPIGNLDEMSKRMADTLSKCDLIAAEDTRVTLKLLNRLNLKKPLISYHEHNENRRTDELIRRMAEENLIVALTCDAGTPCISDPGSYLVRAAHGAGIRVTPVCGPSAVAAAVSVSGFDARSFAFYGFLPREKKPLRDKLRTIRESGVPVLVFYESPHRVVKLVETICGEWPLCDLCVCCDISKLYENVLVGPCCEVLAAMKANPNVEKGEYCLVADLSPMPPVEAQKETPPSAELAILEGMLSGLSLDEALKSAQERGFTRNRLYRAKLVIKERFAGLE